MEARFLAAQAERLAENKRRHQNSRQHKANNDIGQNYFDDNAPSLSDEDKALKFNATKNDVVGDDHRCTRKEEGHRFWINFRKMCSEMQLRVDSLLLMSDDNESTNGEQKYAAAKAYYYTAARRREGRIKLDSILNKVRLLRSHCLSSSSIMKFDNSTLSELDNDDNANQLLLNSILSSPTPEMTQTDLRLLSEEIDRLLKVIEDARAIISPKEKFVFKRYRKAMEERRLLGGDGDVNSSRFEPGKIGDGAMHKETTAAEEESPEEAFRHDGGMLENKNDCVIEIFPNGSIQVDEMTESRIQYYNSPRLINSLHPPILNNNSTQQSNAASLSSDGSSFLLQNLTNVTILLHGSRPTLHIKNIHNCHIYVTEPTLGPVHLTNCHSSEIRCSCYQLRIHDSTNVKFGVWVRSGPIIENCKEMVFEGNYYSGDESGVGKNMFRDVKDFNWLRTLRKSPNFVVIVADYDESSVKDEVPPVKVDQVAETSTSQQLPSQEEEDEEDSEDEL